MGLSVAQELSQVVYHTIAYIEAIGIANPSNFPLQAAIQDMLSTQDSNGELLSSEWTESKQVLEVAIIAQGRRDSRMRLSYNLSLRNNDSFGDVEFKDVLQDTWFHKKSSGYPQQISRHIHDRHAFQILVTERDHKFKIAPGGRLLCT